MRIGDGRRGQHVVDVVAGIGEAAEESRDHRARGRAGRRVSAGEHSCGAACRRKFGLEPRVDAVPRHRLAVQPRLSNPLAVIESQDGGLARGTQPALRHGVPGQPLELHRPAITNRRKHAAAGAAARARGRVLEPFSRRRHFRLHEVRHAGALGRATATGHRGRGDRETCGLQESATRCGVELAQLWSLNGDN